jgi:hypothetical protein
VAQAHEQRASTLQQSLILQKLGELPKKDRVLAAIDRKFALEETIFDR